MKDITLVLGASLKEERYSNKAIKLLVEKGVNTLAIGNREGEIAGVKILKEQKEFTGIDTVTLYLNAKIQEDYYNYILNLKPRRVIFNPGTENPYFMELLEANQIKVEIACTLVLLSINQYD